jgi:hypothetical protein
LLTSILSSPFDRTISSTIYRMSTALCILDNPAHCPISLDRFIQTPLSLTQSRPLSPRCLSTSHPPRINLAVVAADSLIKRDILRLPDPFAIVSVDSEQIYTTSVIKRTLNPYWNENFDITVKDSSVVAVQIFDQRKFKRKVGCGGYVLG